MNWKLQILWSKTEQIIKETKTVALKFLKYKCQDNHHVPQIFCDQADNDYCKQP